MHIPFRINIKSLLLNYEPTSFPVSWFCQLFSVQCGTTVCCFTYTHSVLFKFRSKIFAFGAFLNSPLDKFSTFPSTKILPRLYNGKVVWILEDFFFLAGAHKSVTLTDNETRILFLNIKKWQKLQGPGHKSVQNIKAKLKPLVWQMCSSDYNVMAPTITNTARRDG